MPVLPPDLFQHICQYLHGYEIYRLNHIALALYKHKWVTFKAMVRQPAAADGIPLLPLLHIWRWFCGSCGKKNWKFFCFLFFHSQTMVGTNVHQAQWYELLYNQRVAKYVLAAALMVRFPVHPTTTNTIALAIRVFSKMYIQKAAEEVRFRVKRYRQLHERTKAGNLSISTDTEPAYYANCSRIDHSHFVWNVRSKNAEFELKDNDFVKKCLRILHVPELATEKLFAPLLNFGGLEQHCQQLQAKLNHFQNILQFFHPYIPSFVLTKVNKKPILQQDFFYEIFVLKKIEC